MSETATVPARERIIAAFLERMKTVPFRNIRVSALIGDADVNRSTFYLYFENTEDLLECIYKCAYCDATETGDRTPAKGHSFTVLVEEKEATCTEGGYQVYKCAGCEATKTKNRTDALGHDFRDGVCTRCSQPDPDYHPGGDSGDENDGNSFADFFARIRDFFRRIVDFFKNLFKR